MTELENIPVTHRRLFFPGPAIVTLLFAQALSGTVLTDLIVYRTCLVSLNMSHTTCFLLRANASSAEARKLETLIEPHTSLIIMAKSLLESIIPAILFLFLGPWSDRGGRKPLLVAGFTGFTLMYVVLSLLCNWNINPWYLLIPSIPMSLMGGTSVIIFASVCYISDTTPENERTMLLTWMQAFVLSGYLVGVFCGPLIYANYGFTIVFSTSAICCILGLLYTYFCVPETVKDTSKESICTLFKISSVKEVVASSLLKRDGFHRSVVWLAISSLAMTVLILEGEVAIGYLFTRERLGWDVQNYAYVTGATILISVIGVLCGVRLFTHVLGFSDTAVATMGLISGLGCAITKSLVSQAWHMYLASCIGLLTGVLGPVMRSIISKSVPPQDLGKVFAVTGAMETLSPLAGAPLYTQAYSHYLPPIYPAPVYLVSASLHILLIIIVGWIEVLIRRSRNSNYTTLVSEE